MESIRRWFRQFMVGRRGPDALAAAAVTLALVLSLVNMFAKASWISLVGGALVVYAVWRMLSRDVATRAREDDAFMRRIAPLRRFASNPKAAVAEARQYRHATCPSCGQGVRVPRGKGKLRVTCPRCGTRFEVRS